MDIKLLSAIEEAKLLGLFKKFCDKRNTIEAVQKIRNILNNSVDKNQTVRNIILNEFDKELNELETSRMLELMLAFLKKSTIRKEIPQSIKRSLLKIQNNKCAICNSEIDISAHTDHIVPFKYVGDELHNNYQMLCTHCNTQKNASIDYQVRFLLGTI